MIQDIPLNLFDVGASGGVQDKWKKLSQLHFYGFEPDDRAPEITAKSNLETWINCAVGGSTGPRKLYLYQEQCNSSFLSANHELIDRLAYRKEDFRVVKEIEVQCDTLDRICDSHKIAPHAIKLDTQGTEYEILTGSNRILSESVWSAEIEVEFLPLYIDQKLFSDIDQFMRQKNFLLMDIGNQLYVKGRRTIDFNCRKGFLVAADALYFRQIDDVIKNRSKFDNSQFLAWLPIGLTYGYLNYIYELFYKLRDVDMNRYSELCDLLKKSPGSPQFPIDLLDLIKKNIPPFSMLTVSERKYAWMRNLLEKRIKNRNAHWNYGLGNPN